MEAKTEYQYKYVSGRVIRIELTGRLIQVFHHNSDCTLIKKTKLLNLKELIDLMPEM